MFSREGGREGKNGRNIIKERYQERGEFSENEYIFEGENLEDGGNNVRENELEGRKY